MRNVTDHYRGAIVLAPPHLAGSRVIAAHLDDEGPAWDHEVELVLDRPHPTEPGHIGVTLDYVILDTLKE